MKNDHRQLTIKDFIDVEPHLVLDITDVRPDVRMEIDGTIHSVVFKSEDLKAVLRDSPTSYLNKSFDIDFNGQHMFVKCIDVEFEGGLGPLFLMENAYGNRFWLTRKEMEKRRVI